MNKEGNQLLSGIAIAVHGWSEFYEGVNVEAIQQPKTWRLIKAINGDSRGAEEMVFVIHGILQDKSLPPLNMKPKMVPSHYRFLKQGVIITGLDTPTFSDSIKSATKIYGLFDRNFAEGRMESWSCVDRMLNKYDSIHASNHYLMPKMEAAGTTHQPFKKLVGPKGILKAMAKEGRVHTENNNVLDTKWKTQAEGKFS
ncbi:hypothetical protein BDZ94DRAFT_1353059 [Collybia nuda]|uniref:Uncharacterized protein n=1 Tax=Collybia nuda TaxID=64659 RepID=A0A9P6CCG4_9AGAR|nr:hypothetical protein BDZ94DRAFT_1353059 [Collybia nuda]